MLDEEINDDVHVPPGSTGNHSIRRVALSDPPRVFRMLSCLSQAASGWVNNVAFRRRFAVLGGT